VTPLSGAMAMPTLVPMSTRWPPIS